MNNKRVILDLETNKLLQKPPNKSKIILTTHNHNILGDYSILVIIIETNKGTVIMKYDEGYRGKDAFDNAIEMLTQYNGVSSVINRALIELHNS
jgi:hypothetical protein